MGFSKARPHRRSAGRLACGNLTKGWSCLSLLRGFKAGRACDYLPELNWLADFTIQKVAVSFSETTNASGPTLCELS